MRRSPAVRMLRLLQSTPKAGAARQECSATFTTRRPQTLSGRTVRRPLDLRRRPPLVRVMDPRLAFRLAGVASSQGHRRCHHSERSHPCRVASSSTERPWTKMLGKPVMHPLRLRRSMRTAGVAPQVCSATSTTRTWPTSRDRMAPPPVRQRSRLPLVVRVLEWRQVLLAALRLVGSASSPAHHTERCRCRVKSRRIKTTSTKWRASPATRLRRLRSSTPTA